MKNERNRKHERRLEQNDDHGMTYKGRVQKEIAVVGNQQKSDTEWLLAFVWTFLGLDLLLTHLYCHYSHPAPDPSVCVSSPWLSVSFSFLCLRVPLSVLRVGSTKSSRLGLVRGLGQSTGCYRRRTTPPSWLHRRAGVLERRVVPADWNGNKGEASSGVCMRSLSSCSSVSGSSCCFWMYHFEPTNGVK